MANLAPITTFTTGDLITPELLHSTLESARLQNIGLSELVSGIGFFNQSVLPAPSDGDVHIQTDGSIHVRFGGSFAALESANYIHTLANNSGVNINAAECVVLDGNGDIEHSSAASADYRVVGFAAEDIADSSSGQVYLRGIVQGLVETTAGFSAGDFLIGPTTGRVAALAKDFGSSSSFGSTAFGIVLETKAAVAGNATVWCRIWR